MIQTTSVGPSSRLCRITVPILCTACSSVLPTIRGAGPGGSNDFPARSGCLLGAAVAFFVGDFPGLFGPCVLACAMLPLAGLLCFFAVACLLAPVRSSHPIAGTRQEMASKQSRSRLITNL